MGLFHRGKKNNDDEPDSVQTNSFSDIMNGLQYAVNCAQDTLQNHQIQNLTRLFEETNANNANTFQSKKIMIGDKTIDIPLINPEKPDVPLNKNDAFQKVQKRHVQEKR